MSPRDAIADLQGRVNQSIIGQERVVERLVVALLANGNVLIEGLPGLAKTRAIKSLAHNLEAEFSRIGEHPPATNWPHQEVRFPLRVHGLQAIFSYSRGSLCVVGRLGF